MIRGLIAAIVLAVALTSGQQPDRFWCPMHPEMRAPAEGKCPLCAMDLVKIPPPKLGDYQLEVTQIPRARGGTRGLRFAIREPDTGATVERFSEIHERLFHLFIVSRDLSFFAHEHPVRRGNAFELDVNLPPGAYMLFADFLPTAGTAQMIQHAIVTPGSSASPFARTDLVVDGSEKQLAGTRIALAVTALQAGKRATLTFTVRDAATGAPAEDLESYLGAAGHLLIVNQELTEAVHAHPEGTPTRGPDVSFDPIFPAAGRYKMWLQVQRGGEVITAPFVVEVR